MAILPVLKYPHPCLQTKTQPLTEPIPDLKKRLEDMFETMYAKKGIGLAANQVGWDRQVVVMDIPKPIGNRFPPGVQTHTNGRICLINPEIITRSEDVDWLPEGCLSFPGLQILIPRHRTITITYRNADFQPQTLTAGGLLAECIQHELEHLAGKTFIDQLSPAERAKALASFQQQTVTPQNTNTSLIYRSLAGIAISLMVQTYICLPHIMAVQASGMLAMATVLFTTITPALLTAIIFTMVVLGITCTADPDKKSLNMLWVGSQKSPAEKPGPDLGHPSKPVLN